jgi:DNA polymerase-3 subunit delta
MPEINYKELKSHIERAEKEGFSGLYLIHGEELIRKAAFEELLNALLPEPASDRSLCYHPIDGTGENISDAVEQANTFSFMAGRKVVAFLDSGMFYSKEDEKKLFDKVKAAYSQNDIKRAAKYFISLMSLLKLSFADVEKENRGKSLKSYSGESDDRLIDDITAYCIGGGMGEPGMEDSSSFFQKAVEKGFPKGNHLIVTAELVDKRLSIFKAVDKNGVIVDCQMPKGDSAKEKEIREKVLLDETDKILLKSGKTMEKAAYEVLFEMTGFDLHMISNNLEKLINYTGKRKKIIISDVETVLERTKTDPIYEFTNAVTDRNIEKSLMLLDSILYSEIHPLQALSAIINQFRKLIFQKGFAESSYGKAWEPGFSYPRFSSVTMPALIEYEKNLLNYIEEWSRYFGDEENNDKTESRKKKTVKNKRNVSSDLFIAKTARSPYPLYQLFKKAEKFRKDELLLCYEELKKADLELKSSGKDPKLILVNVIFRVCL